MSGYSIPTGQSELDDVVRNVMQGKVNASGELTLVANAATTIVLDVRVGPLTTILLMPLTANAAAAAPVTFVSARTDGSFTLTHANNAQIDKTFGYIVIG